MAVYVVRCPVCDSAVEIELSASSAPAEYHAAVERREAWSHEVDLALRREIERGPES